MIRPLRFLRMSAACCVAAAFLLAPTGCQQDKKQPVSKYPILGKRPVPGFMKGTVYETTDLENTNPFLISGWGLVVNLDGTGGSDQVPNVVIAD